MQHTNLAEQLPALVTIAEAIVPYRGVTVAMVRAWCRNGRLPFVKCGKRNLIDPLDLAHLLEPRLRAAAPKAPRRETENQRAARQLREAGFGT